MSSTWAAHAALWAEGWRFASETNRLELELQVLSPGNPGPLQEEEAGTVGHLYAVSGRRDRWLTVTLAEQCRLLQSARELPVHLGAAVDSAANLTRLIISWPAFPPNERLLYDIPSLCFLPIG